jgi:hypothetical protein
MEMKLQIDYHSEQIWKKSFGGELMVLVHIYKTHNELSIVHTIDEDKDHLSISHPRRQPSWNEIKEIKYQLLPDVDMTIALPPEKEYVNIHNNCFHIFEV